MMRLPLWRLSTARRKLFEALGSAAYSRPAYGEIDRKLDRYFRDCGVSRGFFVEAGAVEGVFESNTYFLERWRGWDGLLVEPRVDLLSLDVEGFELQVLQGLDFQRSRIDTIVIECLTEASREESHAFLSTDFAFQQALTDRDFLYARR